MAGNKPDSTEVIVARHSKAIARLIDDVSAGEPFTRALEKNGIDFATLKRIEKDDGCKQSIALARELGAAAMAESLLTIGEKFDNPAMARVVSQNLQWYLERVHRRVYAPSVDINVTQTLDISGVLSGIQERVNRTSRPIIDLENIEDSEIVAESGLPAIGASDYESAALDFGVDLGLPERVKINRLDWTDKPDIFD
jgi:hypothetical protein